MGHRLCLPTTWVMTRPTEPPSSTCSIQLINGLPWDGYTTHFLLRIPENITPRHFKCKYQYEGMRGEGVRLTQSLICITLLSRWVSVFTKTLCLLLLFAHIYSGTLQQGGTNWTPDEIGSASYTDRLDKVKPAWPLNKHLQPLFGLWAPAWTPSMEGKQCTRTSPSRPHTTCRCAALHSWGGVCHDKLSLWHVCESGPHRWSVFMHRNVLEPNGQPLFLSPPACMRTQRHWHTSHSHIPNQDERRRCQKMIQPPSVGHLPTNTCKHSILIKILWPLHQQCVLRAV